MALVAGATSADAAAGGAVTLQGGNGLSLDPRNGGDGGAILLEGGAALGRARCDVGGSMMISGGSATCGTGGSVTLQSGIGHAGSSGRVIVGSPDVGGDGASGAVTIATGDAVTADSGQVSIDQYWRFTRWGGW